MSALNDTSESINLQIPCLTALIPSSSPSPENKWISIIMSIIFYKIK